MTELQRTGFFREMSHGEPTDPGLAEARNPTPSAHEDRIAGYLEAGHVYIATPGVTHDVFDRGTAIGPPHYLTDGRFVWPGDLAHYVRSYHVRLEGRFIEHMLASGWTVPAEIDLTTLALPARATKPANAPADAPGDPSEQPDLAATIARFLASLSGPSGAGTEAIASLKKSLEEASDGLARAAETFGSNVRTALDTARVDARTHLSASLRNLTDWLDKPEDDRSKQLQSAMTLLQTRIDEALAPERRAETAERARRLAKEVRGTIAVRLRQHGLDPGDTGDDK